MNEISSANRSYIVYCTASNPFSLDVQTDDGLLEAEICSCKLLPPAIYTHNNIVVFDFKRLLYNIGICAVQRNCSKNHTESINTLCRQNEIYCVQSDATYNLTLCLNGRWFDISTESVSFTIVKIKITG